MKKLTLGRLAQRGDAGAGSQAPLSEFQARCYHHLWILLLCIRHTKFHGTSEALNSTRFLKGAFVFKCNSVLRKIFLNKGIICFNTMECHRILQLQINYRSLELWPLRSPVSSTNSLFNRWWNWSPGSRGTGPSSCPWSITGSKRKMSHFSLQCNIWYKSSVILWTLGHHPPNFPGDSDIHRMCSFPPITTPWKDLQTLYVHTTAQVDTLNNIFLFKVKKHINPWLA